MRSLRLRSQILQSLVVGCVALVCSGGLWLILWPFGGRVPGALGVGLLSAIFCGAASWLRSHDDAWEAENLRLEPMLSRPLSKRASGAEDSRKSISEVGAE